jgi:molecular chaperone DnaK
MAAYNTRLGMFELDGLPPAPRNVPQIEVTFDIDANGIVHVSAKDRGTGKEQSMTITGGSALPKDEVERMMREAETHAEEDRARRDEVEVRNNAESLVYQTEKFLADNGDKVGEVERKEVDDALEGLRESLKGTEVAAIRTAHDNLQTVSQKMGQAMYDQAAAAEAAGQAGGSAAADDDVVDAEIVDEPPAESA